MPKNRRPVPALSGVQSWSAGSPKRRLGSGTSHFEPNLWTEDDGDKHFYKTFQSMTNAHRDLKFYEYLRIN